MRWSCQSSGSVSPARWSAARLAKVGAIKPAAASQLARSNPPSRRSGRINSPCLVGTTEYEKWCPMWISTSPVRLAKEGRLTGSESFRVNAPHALFDFYNQRQTIEAFFKASKQVFGMANLRSCRFMAIAAFLGFVFLTHNLLVWTKAALFAGTRLVAMHTREMEEKIIGVPAFLVRHGEHTSARTASRWRARPKAAGVSRSRMAIADSGAAAEDRSRGPRAGISQAGLP